MPSKQEIIAEKIMKRIHVQNKDLGGLFSITTGGQGVGKTGTMLSFAEYTMKQYPNQKIFWSECFDAPLQFTKLGDENKWKVFVQGGVNLVFRDRNNYLKPINLEHTTFSDYENLWNKALPGKVNVVFFNDRAKWMEWIGWLRSTGEWNHTFIEELGEICPSTSREAMWKRIQTFADTAKDIRKCMMNVHCNTQTLQDIDYRVRQKIMLYIFLPGAKVGRSATRVTQTAVDNLPRDPNRGNSAYLDLMGEFGVTTFSDIYTPNKNFHVDAHLVDDNNGERL
jgi:hypothetical protein